MPEVPDGHAGLEDGNQVIRVARIAYMSRVEEIERAIQELSADEFARIAQRVHALEQERWDTELDHDARSGKLAFLVVEAQEDREHGRLRDWPDPE